MAASRRALPVVWVLAGLFLRGRPRSMAGATVSGLTLRVVGVLLLYLLMGVMALSTWKLGLFERSTTLHAFTLMMVGMMMAGSSGALLFNAEEADILVLPA